MHDFGISENGWRQGAGQFQHVSCYNVQVIGWQDQSFSQQGYRDFRDVKRHLPLHTVHCIRWTAIVVEGLFEEYPS